MAMAGLRELGVTDPEKRHSLVVYVEVDRCIADAIQIVSGCTVGRRSLKVIDYGKFAATFVNVTDCKAVRVASKKEARPAAMKFAEEEGWLNPGERIAAFTEREKELMVRAYSEMPEEDLIDITRVKVNVPNEDLPGKPMQISACESCGEQIFDHREIIKLDQTLCKSCANGSYYEEQAHS
jgi:formylmethanofuran dehydrogenase subunit E